MANQLVLLTESDLVVEPTGPGQRIVLPVSHLVEHPLQDTLLVLHEDDLRIGV